MIQHEVWRCSRGKVAMTILRRYNIVCAAGTPHTPQQRTPRTTRTTTMALTKTNTDDLCLPTTGHNPLILRWEKFLYRYHLWTGLYMLETHERIAFHIVVGPVVLAACLYVGVFFDGIVQGWRSSD
jgi:hypothetical protein